MPVALPLLVPLALILSAMVVVALHQTENMWLRPLLESLSHPRGSFLKRLAFKVASYAVAGVLFIERHVRAALSHWAAAHLAPLTRFFHGLTTLVVGLAKEIEALPADVADALSYLRHHTLPHLIRAAVRPVDRLAHRAYAQGAHAISLAHRAERDFTRGIDRLRRTLELELHKLARGIDRLIRENVIPRLRRVEHELAGVVTRDLPAIRRGELALERRLIAQGARLTRLEKLLGGGVLAGLLVRTIAARWPWLFCRNWKRVGSKVCSLHSGLLDLLLGLGGAMFIFDELCRLIESVAALAARVLPKMIAVMAVAGAALCDGRHSEAADLPLQESTLPQVSDPLPL